MRLQDYIDLWMDTYVQPAQARNTVRAYRFALAHLSGELMNCELEQLSPIALQREINALAAVYSRQAQLLYIALHAALKRAVRLRLIEANPMELVDKPEHKTARADYLRADEAAAYARVCQQQPAGNILLLMLCLGLRRNEARALRPCDLDADGILHISQQRRGSDLVPLKSAASMRDIPVPEPLRAVFSGPSGDYLADVSETALRRQHMAVLAAIGVDRRITLHGLRHTAATLAIANGATLAGVQKLLGHAHFGLTADLYTHADLMIVRRCTDALINLFSSPIRGKSARLEIV